MKSAAIATRLTAATLLTIVAFAGASAGESDGPVSPDGRHTSRKEKPKPALVREVSINPAREVAECHRYRPTGSHIAVVRCVAKVDPNSPQALAERTVLQNDVDEMRHRQMLQEQLRQGALAEAIRRLPH